MSHLGLTVDCITPQAIAPLCHDLADGTVALAFLCPEDAVIPAREDGVVLIGVRLRGRAKSRLSVRFTRPEWLPLDILIHAIERKGTLLLTIKNDSDEPLILSRGALLLEALVERPRPWWRWW